MDFKSMFKGKSVSKNLALASTLLGAAEFDLEKGELETGKKSYEKFKKGSGSFLVTAIKVCTFVSDHKEEVFEIGDAIFSDKKKAKKVIDVLQESLANILEVLSEITKK